MMRRHGPIKSVHTCARMFVLAACVALAACKPAPPPDITKRQRDALDSAKAVDDVIQKQADDQRRRIDDAGR